jgi:uracil-DNA glycosylase
MKRLVMMFSSLSISSPFLRAPSSLGRKKRASLKPFFLHVARYGSDAATNNEDDDEKFLSLLERITLSLRIESRHQFSNVEGKQMPFSTFARAYFPKIVVNVEKEKERAVLEGFAKYETLTREERETVVKEAGILVERLVSREKTKTKEKSRANDAAKAAATVESAAPSVVSSSSVHARAGSSFSDIAQSSPLARPSPSSSGTSTSRQILPKERAIGKSFIVDTPQWEHALKEDARRRKELEKVVEQKKDEGAKKERDDEKSANVNATASTPPVKVQDFGSEEEDESQKQGTDEWKALRATRLTASAFSNAVGFWRDGRNALWEEKLGIGIPFTGNEATEWGTKTEDEACEAYAALTNASVSHLLFRALSPDEAELWMGASPDGLVVAATTDAAEYKSEVANNGDASDSLNNNERGILEVKCPFNRGKPLEAKPYPKVPWYYVPQVQGLMAVFDRPWVDVFAYTVNNGCAIYRVKRDREYWAQMYEALSEFWWQHVVPAKHAMHRGLDFEKYRPSEEHYKCQTLKVKSQRIANESTTWVISKKDLDEIIARHRATKKAAENNNTNASEEEFVVFDSTTTTTTRAKSSSNDDQRVSDSTKKVLNETALEPSWRVLLADEFHQPYLEFGLNEFLDDEFQNNKKVFPPKDLIFNAFEKTPVDKVKVVIVGQDPYHNDDQAMGLAFSVPRETTKIPPSLKNIFKELEEDTREARERGDEEVEFTIPAHGDLTKWAEQGVLLLNTSLTVRAHEANSHSGKGWETFTDRAIEQLSQNTENVVFLLWGKNATSKERLIAEGHNHFILKCAHPSPLSASRGFFGCRHFSQTNEFLREVGRETIDWRL